MPPAELLHAENLALKREVEDLKGTNALLRWQIEKLQKQVFGPGKSEKLDRAQLLFQLKELEAMAEKASQPAQAVSYERRVPEPEKRTTPAELFAKLPVKEVVVIEPEEVKAEPEACRLSSRRAHPPARDDQPRRSRRPYPASLATCLIVCLVEVTSTTLDCLVWVTHTRQPRLFYQPSTGHSVVRLRLLPSRWTCG